MIKISLNIDSEQYQKLSFISQNVCIYNVNALIRMIISEYIKNNSEKNG